MVPIYKPFITTLSLKFARDALSSGWVSSKGIYIEIAEKRLREMFGYKHVLLTSSGTTAMHLVAKALQYKHPNIKGIVCPNNVYVGAYNPFLYDKDFYYLLPFDADINTWQMDYNEFDLFISNYKLNIDHWALLVVHNVSSIVNIPLLKRKRPNMVIVEDNCEGLFGVHEGEYTGTKSLCAGLSYFGNKTLTAGEGGAFITDDNELYAYINILHNQGQAKKRYVHDYMGYNYRMTNVQAGLLLGQLQCAKVIMTKKIKLYKYYVTELAEYIDNGRIRCQEIDDKCDNSNWMFAIRVPGNKNYEQVEQFFNDGGVETRPIFYPITHHKYLQKYIGMNTKTDIAELLSKECFMLPSYPEISEKDREKVVKIVKKYMEKK
jgi:perosamine synthetase